MELRLLTVLVSISLLAAAGRRRRVAHLNRLVSARTLPNDTTHVVRLTD